MKVLIQSLGEVPSTVEFALEKEKPDITYIICSKYQMQNIASGAGYSEPNGGIVKKAVKKAGAKVRFQVCNTFDPIAVCKAISEVMKAVDLRDEITINYAGGSACVRLMLGLTGILFSEFLPIKVVYSVRYRDGIEVYQDQTGKLREIFKQTREFFGLDSFKKIIETKVTESLTFYQNYGVAQKNLDLS